MAMHSPKETITLSWTMDDDSWSHLAQGLGRQTVSSVVRKGLKEIRKSPKARKEIKSWCERIKGRRERGLPNRGDQEANTETRLKFNCQSLTGEKHFNW